MTNIFFLFIIYILDVFMLPGEWCFGLYIEISMLIYEYLFFYVYLRIDRFSFCSNNHPLEIKIYDVLERIYLHNIWITWKFHVISLTFIIPTTLLIRKNQQTKNIYIHKEYVFIHISNYYTGVYINFSQTAQSFILLLACIELLGFKIPAEVLFIYNKIT